jgi:hypothetical protein
MAVMSNTPDNITELKPNQIFVFGSNQNGEHIGGAARTAYDKFGAVWGKPEGLQDRSYALPTVSKHFRPYSLRMIGKNVYTFLWYASKHPELTFLLTKVGCGIAGHKEEDIAPLFKHAPSNVIKPRGW